MAPRKVNSDTIVSRILEYRESAQFEVKRIGKLDQVLKAMVAFANSSGGVIVIGVEDPEKAEGNERLYGIEENPEAFDQLQTQWLTRITPEIANLVQVRRIPTLLRNGRQGTIGLVQVQKSAAVHSIVNGGTYTRDGTSNRQLSAEAITRLSFRRGSVSAVNQTVDVDPELLDTTFWRDYKDQRKLTRPLVDALKHIGLFKLGPAGTYQATRAAVLLFAEEPGGLLDIKCSIRIFHYKGETIERVVNTNLVRPPITIGGPIVQQIREAVKAVTSELAKGVQVSTLGFEIAQRYPVRVIQEAITNAVLHRDYSLNRDIQINIFASSITIDSPGDYPGEVTAQNISEKGTVPRNRSLVDHVRAFPNPPNLDAGEGVPAMFATMQAANLYPPQYLPCTNDEERVRVVLRNNERPTIWEQVCQHLDRHHSIGNKEVRLLLKVDDALRASKQLRTWVEQGVLVALNPAGAKSQRRYNRPNEPLLASLPFSENRENDDDDS